MDIKQERIIRAVVERFEAGLLGFVQASKEQGQEIDNIYFSYAISKAANQYARNYVKSHAFIQIFGSRRLSTLGSIYIPQKFQAYNSIRNFESVDELEEAFARDLQRSNYNKGNNLLGLNLANEEACLTILGMPAVGKTTFLKYVGLEALRYPEGRYQHDVLPVFIQMWKFCHGNHRFLDAIAEEFEKAGFPFSQEIAMWLLEKGKLLILLDGLNEAVTPQHLLAKQLREFIKTYPQNRYIASSRLVCYQNSLGQSLEVTLQPWGDLLIQEYIHKWFAIAYKTRSIHSHGDLASQRSLDQAIASDDFQEVASDKAQQFWRRLQLNTTARQLAESPLALSLLCFLGDRQHSFPSHISHLYRKAIQLSLEEQVYRYQSSQDRAAFDLSTDILELALMEVAHAAFENRQIVLPLESVSDRLQIMLASCQNISVDTEVDTILDIFQKIGICKITLIESSPSFVFSHIFFQEYFAAKYICDRHQVRQAVIDHLSDRRWQEIFLLLSGMMMGDVEELLWAMEVQAITYLNTKRLSSILEWLDQISHSCRSDLSAVARRVAFLVIARPRFLTDLPLALSLTRMLETLRSLYANFDTALNFEAVVAADLTISLAHALDFDNNTELNLAMQLCQNLAKLFSAVKFNPQYVDFQALYKKLTDLSTQVPRDDQSFEVREDFRRKVSQTWFQSLYLPLDLNYILPSEVESLTNYLYANLLMVECKNSAIAVSPKIWTEIESHILKIWCPPDSL